MLSTPLLDAASISMKDKSLTVQLEFISELKILAALVFPVPWRPERTRQVGRVFVASIFLNMSTVNSDPKKSSKV